MVINMLKLAFVLIKKKRKKYWTIFLCVVTCAFFIAVIEGIYMGHHAASIDEAYYYGGKYDVAVYVNPDMLDNYSYESEKGCLNAVNEVTYSVRQDKIPENTISPDQKSYMEYNYMSLMGIRDGDDVIQTYDLREGRWPENADELVVSLNFILEDGRSVRTGSIKVGDTVNIKYGIRKNEEGDSLQGEISGPETFEVVGEKEFRICGIFSYKKILSGQHICYGYYKYGALEPRETALYYVLNDANYEELKAFEKNLKDSGVQKVSTNRHIESALESFATSDYISSIENGILILEVLLIAVALGIIAVNQYQNILEDTEQIRLLSRIGAESDHLCFLYIIPGIFIIAAGFVTAYVLSVIFLKIYGTVLLNNTFSYGYALDYFNINLKMYLISFVLTLLESCCVIRTVVIKRLLINEDSYKKSKRKRQYPVKNLLGLVRIMNRGFSVKRIAKTAIIVCTLTIIPICFTTGISVYRGAEELIVESEADFLLNLSGTTTFTDEAGLRSIEGIKSIDKFAKAASIKILLSRDVLGEDVFRELKSRSWNDEYFNEADEFTWVVEIIFPDKKTYDKYYYDEYNGCFPEYDRFNNGNCVILGVNYYIKDTETIVDIGKQIAEKYGTVCLHSFEDNDIGIELDVCSSYLDKHKEDDSVFATIIAPTKLYDEFFSGGEYHHMVQYGIDAESGSYEKLSEQLHDLAFRNNMGIMDYYAANKEHRSYLIVRLTSLITCIFIVIIVCFIVLHSVNTLESISKRKRYTIFGMLGIKRGSFVLLRGFEDVIYILDGLIIALLFHIVSANTFLKGLYLYYDIRLTQICFAGVICLVVFVVLTFVSSLKQTKVLYNTD